MSFSKFPVEVVEDHILKLLDWNDLLRVRRTCKENLTFVMDYISKHPERAPEIKLGLVKDTKGFQNLLDTGIFTDRLYLKSSLTHYQSFYADSDKMQKVKHLHLQTFRYQCSPQLMKFYESFPNLESVTADEVQQYHYGRIISHPDLPKSFRNLKVLDIPISSIRGTLQNWLKSCTALEEIRLTIKSSQWDWPPNVSTQELFQALVSHIRSRPSETRPMKLIAFNISAPERWLNNPNTDQWAIREAAAHRQSFFDLLELCRERNIQLHGILSEWLFEAHGNQAVLTDEMASPFVSMTCHRDYACLWMFDFSNLETLELKSAWMWPRGFAVINEHLPGAARPTWHKLKTLKVDLLSKREMSMNAQVRFTQLQARRLFEALFNGTVWESVEQFEIRFPPIPALDGVASTEILEQLILCCPNLKKLKLAGWSSSSQDLSAILGRMVGLEEIELSECHELRNLNDVGFKNLPNLRKLCIDIKVDNPEDLEKGPAKISQGIFASVIREMKLTHFAFSFSSEKNYYYNQYIPDWISALNGGPFAETIQEFRVNGCRVHQAAYKEVREVGKSFRSSNMI